MAKDAYKVEQLISSYLIPTYNCNNHCSWCYAEYYRQQRMPIMDIELAKNCIRLIAELGIKRCNLVGGEPTVYPYIWEVIKEGKKNNIEMVLVSNGRRLANKDFVDKLTDAGVDKINISIQGASPEFHGNITENQRSFTETLEGIKNCIKADFKFQTATVVGKDDISEYERLIDLLHNLGVKNMLFNSCLPALKANNEYEEPPLYPAKSAKIIESLYIYGKKKEAEIFSILRLPLCSISPEVRKDMLEKNLIQNGCQVYSGITLVINPDGTILPCSHWMGYTLMDIVKNRKMHELVSSKILIKMWNSGKPLQLRKEMWRYRSKKCIGCKYWGKYCYAGCPLFWYKFNPEEEIPGLN
jgi:radical SAM protein with 4Fe4S-binding SPASM domain